MICQEDDGGHLHSFCTLEADRNLSALQEYGLLSRISGGDVIAIEEKYHMRCLTNLRNRHKSQERKKKIEAAWEAKEDSKINESKAFS